jgi:hypothetical protein
VLEPDREFYRQVLLLDPIDRPESENPFRGQRLLYNMETAAIEGPQDEVRRLERQEAEHQFEEHSRHLETGKEKQELYKSMLDRSDTHLTTF